MSITNPFVSANATFNPGQYAVNPEEEGQYQDTSLSAGGSPVVNPLSNLSQMLGGSNLSNPSADGGIGATSNIFNNPYQGQTGPVVGRQVVDYTPPTSQPVYNPNTGTSRTMPNMAVTGGAEFDGFDNRVGNFSVGSGTAGMFTGDGSNIGDSINSSLKSTFGDFYNDDFAKGTGARMGYDSYNSYAAPNRAFNFGDTSLGQYGAQEFGISKQAYGQGRYALGELGKFASATGRYDTANKLNTASKLLSMNGNNAFDTLTSMSNNRYVNALGMLNDDWSPRGTMKKALSLGKVPYAGGIMALTDYSQGRNNYGALGQYGSMLLGANPLVAYGAGLIGDWYGKNYGDKFNENRVGPGREWAESQGLSVGRPGYDKALTAWDKAARKGTLTEDQQFYVEDWNNNKFDPKFLEQNMLGGSTIDDPNAVFVGPESLEEALEYKERWGKEGDASWTPGDGQTYHSNKYDWNGMQQNRAEVAAEKAQEFIRVEEDRVQAEKVAAEQQRQAEAARVAEQQRQAQARAQAQAQAQAQQEKEAMQSAGNYSAWDDSGGWNDSAFDSGGNYSDWGSSESFEDDQGGSDWW